jgi:hypothetical protein
MTTQVHNLSLLGPCSMERGGVRADGRDHIRDSSAALGLCELVGNHARLVGKCAHEPLEVSLAQAFEEASPIRPRLLADIEQHVERVLPGFVLIHDSYATCGLNELTQDRQ